MSILGSYNIFSRLMVGFVKSIEIFCITVSELIIWYEENSDKFSKYSLAFENFEEWAEAINKLIELQFVFTDNLTPDLAHEICQGENVEEVITHYYFDNNGLNMQAVIQRCKDSNCIREYRELYNQILNAYDKEDYLLACIGLFSLVDGLLAEYSGMVKETSFKTRLDRISNKLVCQIELNENDKKDICICEAFSRFDCSVFKKSDFSEDEPQIVNRHWDVHGRSRREHTKIDFLKVFLWLDAVVYLYDKSTQLKGMSEYSE